MFPMQSKTDSWEKLEKDANNDLQMLAEYGPSFFEARQLTDMRQQVKEHIQIFERRQRLAMLLGATGIFWMVASTLGRLVGWNWLFVLAGICSVFCFGGYVFILLAQKKIYESKGELDYSLQEIEGELKSRQFAQASASRRTF